MHSMMGTLPGKEAWFATLEAAGVPCFDDAETMAECAGLLARYPDLQARAKQNAEGPVALRRRGGA
jgi:acetyltransferase